MNAEWNMEGLKKEILRWLNDTLVCQPDSEGRVEFSICMITSGANGPVNQARHIFEAFNMKVPEDWKAENPDAEYNPGEDEYVWDDIDQVTAEDSNAITEALAADESFATLMETKAEEWGTYFGNREADGDYCLFFWYRTKE